MTERPRATAAGDRRGPNTGRKLTFVDDGWRLLRTEEGEMTPDVLERPVVGREIFVAANLLG